MTKRLTKLTKLKYICAGCGIELQKPIGEYRLNTIIDKREEGVLYPQTTHQYYFCVECSFTIHTRVYSGIKSIKKRKEEK